MGMYLARLTDDKQIVGFFHVGSDDELFWLIDECCDPYQVEIADIGTGGLYWSTTVDFSVPIPDDEHGEPIHEGLPPNPTLNSEWTDALFGNEELLWRPVPPNPDLEH